MSRSALVVSKQLENVLTRRPWRLDRALFKEYKQLPSGFIPFSAPSTKIFGNVLYDESLSFPIQIVNYSSEPSFLNVEYIEKSLRDAWTKRKTLSLAGKLDLSNTSAFRLVNENYDGFPGLSIEVFGSYAVIHVYSRHWLQHLKLISGWILRESAQDWARPIIGVYLADHIRDELHLQAKESAAAAGRAPAPKCIAGRAAPGHSTTIVENGAIYQVALANGSATGLYLDQRANRKKIVELFSKLPPSTNGKIMLNAFSYTGSFSVAACLGVPGLQTLNIDPSAPATEIAIANFSSNKIDVTKHRFQSKDVFASMTALDNTNAQFDVVVVDPPTVSRFHRPDGKLFTFSTLSNYDELASLAAPLVAPGGFLVTFMNTRTLDAEKWEKDVQKGIASIVDRKKQLFEFLSFAETRKKLRKRPDLRKKPRDRLLREMASDGKFEVSKEDIEKMYSFTKIDQWTQDVDFGWHESDSAGQYLHGLVFQRSTFVPPGIKIPPAPPLLANPPPPAKPSVKTETKKSR